MIFLLSKALLIFDSGPKLVEYLRQVYDFRSQFFNRFSIIISNGVLDFLNK